MPSSHKIKLADLGEFGVISLIQGIVKKKKSILGIGDDAAVFDEWKKGKKFLITTDMLLEGRHFTRSIGAKNIGYKALACSISDIAAMGGLPLYAVVSLSVPPGMKITFLRDIYKGMEKIARLFDVYIIGGDTTAHNKIIINVTLIGEASSKSVIKRSGAKEGDFIFITGRLGGCLKTKKHYSFIPRIKEAQFLVKRFNPSSMIDISDGLSSDLMHVLRSSGVGAVIYADLVPKTKGVNLSQALHSGEDFELLFTLPVLMAKRLLRLEDKKFKFTCIGQIIKNKNELFLIGKEGKRRGLTTKGYVHF